MGRAQPLFFSLLAALAVASVAVECNTYDASLLEGDATNTPARKNGVGWWSKKDGRGCFSAGIPKPEDRPSPRGDKDVGPIVLAVSSMRLGSLNEQGQIDKNAWQDLGFDLDGVCTASDTCPSDDPPPGCQSPSSQLVRDGFHCRDNTFGRLEYSATAVTQLAGTYGLSDDAFNCALCAGQYNFLFRITGYNGEADDDRVRIDIYPSPGLEAPLPLDCRDPGWKDKNLCFSADMPWTVQDTSVAEPRGGPDLPPSKVFDDAAYVREGYVVTRLPGETLFWFPGYKAAFVSFPVRIQQGLVIGKLARGADRLWTISDGVIAGRVRREHLIEGFQLIGFCRENEPNNYGLMETFINENLDVLADGRSDAKSACDAMSLGLGFAARQARAGKLEPVAPLEPCTRGPAVDGGADAGGVDAGPDGS